MMCSEGYRLIFNLFFVISVSYSKGLKESLAVWLNVVHEFEWLILLEFLL
jgi:hypothetical protein